MKLLSLFVFAFVVLQVAAHFEWLPAPYCICGTTYKLKLAPMKIHKFESDCCEREHHCPRPAVCRPQCNFCQMKKTFSDCHHSHNPCHSHNFCPKPECSCGCKCY